MPTYIIDGKTAIPIRQSFCRVFSLLVNSLVSGKGPAAFSVRSHFGWARQPCRGLARRISGWDGRASGSGSRFFRAAEGFPGFRPRRHVCVGSAAAARTLGADLVVASVRLTLTSAGRQVPGEVRVHPIFCGNRLQTDRRDPVQAGGLPLVKAGVNAPRAIECCVDSNHRTGFLD